MNITLDLKSEQDRGSYPDNLAFGANFSDHMFTQKWSSGTGWHDARIAEIEDFNLHPAAAVLHYGQEIFEGLKAYRTQSGRITLFRADRNVARFNASAKRVSMPEVDETFHLDAIKKLVSIDRNWVPNQEGASLYLRPAMIATSPKLGLGAANDYLHFIIASPVGAYFKAGFDPVSVYVSDICRRAVVGGVGEAKTGGNYAASLYVGEEVAKKGYSQVLWLDAIEGRYIEEVGAMNICFVYSDGSIATPELSGSILPGITRDSVIQLAPTLGHEVREERLDIEETLADIERGKITEVFGCGTAAVISPVGKLAYKGKQYVINDSQAGPVSKKLFDQLTGIQFGRVDDPFGWVIDVEKT